MTLPANATDPFESSGPEATPTPNERGLSVLRRIKEWLEAHRWVLVVAVPFLVIVKVLRVAEGDMGTAQVIVAAQGVAGLTPLVLLSLLPGAVVVAFVLAVRVAGDITEAKNWKLLWIPELAILSVTAYLSLQFMRPLLFTNAAVLSLFLASFIFIYNRIQRKWRQKRKRPVSDEIGSHGWPEIVVLTALAAIAGALISAVCLASMWAPAERITLKGDASPVVGYVLSEDVNRAVILREADRTTVEYRSAEIEERQRCELTERQVQQQYSELAADLISRFLDRSSSDYPDCPS